MSTAAHTQEHKIPEKTTTTTTTMHMRRRADDGEVRTTKPVTTTTTTTQLDRFKTAYPYGSILGLILLAMVISAFLLHSRYVHDVSHSLKEKIFGAPTPASRMEETADYVKHTGQNLYNSASGLWADMSRKLGMGHIEDYTPDMIKAAKEVFYNPKKATWTPDLIARAREILHKTGLIKETAEEAAKAGMMAGLLKKGKDAFSGAYDSAAETADTVTSKLGMHKTEEEVPERRGWLQAAKDKITGREEEVTVNDGRSAVGGIAHTAGEALTTAGETLKGAGERILHSDVAQERVHTEKRRKH
jgi:hypothetical protein